MCGTGRDCGEGRGGTAVVLAGTVGRGGNGEMETEINEGGAVAAIGHL